MRFSQPELLIFFLGAAIFWWFSLRKKKSAWLRLFIFVIFSLALARPTMHGPKKARRTLLLLDHSRSVGKDGLKEGVHLAEQLAHSGLSNNWVIGFGKHARVVSRPGDSLEGLEHMGFEDDSDLTAALRLAAMQSTLDDPAQVLVVSDGLYTKDNPLGELGTLRQNGVVVFAHPLNIDRRNDSLITHLHAPRSVPQGQPYNIAVEVYSKQSQGAQLLVLDRDERLVETLPVQLRPGKNRFAIPLTAGSPGLSELSIRLKVKNDPIIENNRAATATLITGPPRIVLFNRGAKETALVRAMKSTGLDVSVRAGSTSLSSASLQGVAAVVLENIPLGLLGDGADRALDHYVRHMGGGLLVTGGRSSFATGGYFKSRLEALLPVVMDRKEELRRPRLALGIVMDRSGSMGAEVSPGISKMSLANRAAIEAVSLLAARDEVTVFAVDTAAHRSLPLTELDDDWRRDGALSQIAAIEAGGGGIFVHLGLAAGMNELLKASVNTRHLVLFSDAADSEEPGDYKKLVREWKSAGGTLSVIALGDESDIDASLLKDIAHLGGGRIFFTEDALQLPRIFAQDIMFVARKTFVEEETMVAPAQGFVGLQLAPSSIPAVGGYNLTYLAKDAELMLVTQDENHAPLAAGWRKSSGRVLALTFEADGPFTGPLGNWPDYKEFLRRSVEWVRMDPTKSSATSHVRLEGRTAIATIELDPRAPAPALKKAIILSPGEPQVLELNLSPVAPHTWEVSFPVSTNGTYHGVVQLDDETLSLAPIVMPYSPEFATHRQGSSGLNLLEQLSAATGGKILTHVDELNDPRLHRGMGRIPLSPYLVLLALLLLLVDIAHRRGLLSPIRSRLKKQRKSLSVRFALSFRRIRRRKNRPLSPATQSPLTVGAPSTGNKKNNESDSDESVIDKTASAAQAKTDPQVDAFALAKKRARQRH